MSCQDQLSEFKAAAGVLMKWLEETKEQVPVVQPNCSEQGLGNDMKKVNVSALSSLFPHTGDTLELSSILYLLPQQKCIYFFLFREEKMRRRGVNWDWDPTGPHKSHGNGCF